METQNISIAIAGAMALFLTLTSPRIDEITSFFMVFGFALIFVSRLTHFLLMQYNRLDKRSHLLSQVITALGILLSLIGLLVGRFLSPMSIIIPVFGYYILIAAFWTFSFVVFQTIALKKFDPSMNIGSSKVEKRRSEKSIAEAKDGVDHSEV